MTGLYGTTAGPWVIDSDGDVFACDAPKNGADLIAFQPEGFDDSMKLWPTNARAIAQVPAMLALVDAVADWVNIEDVRDMARAIVRELEAEK